MKLTRVVIDINVLKRLKVYSRHELEVLSFLDKSNKFLVTTFVCACVMGNEASFSSTRFPFKNLACRSTWFAKTSINLKNPGQV